jgi:hypothetical protein
MFDFLRNKRQKNELRASVAPSSVAGSSTLQRSNIRRELIRVVLKDTLRLHGIPFDWLACEVIIIPIAHGEEELRIQIVVLKWKEHLLRYAPALQQQLLLGLDRFDPSVDHSKYIVSWRFSPDCGYPFSRMPDPKFWLKSTAPPAFEEPESVLDRRHTRRLPVIRPSHPSSAGSMDQSDGFLPTHHIPLNRQPQPASAGSMDQLNDFLPTHHIPLS